MAYLKNIYIYIYIYIYECSKCQILEVHFNLQNLCLSGMHEPQPQAFGCVAVKVADWRNGWVAHERGDCVRTTMRVADWLWLAFCSL